MKTTLKQLAFAAPILLLTTVIIFSSFKPVKRNSIANGGGVADGIHFNFNAIEQKDGVVTGHIQFGAGSYSVNCAQWYVTYAILFTTDGHAFLVYDNGEPSSSDYISEPILASCSPFVSASDFHGLHPVASGNIQVKE